MKKLKNLLTQLSGEIKELGKKFPLTMMLIGFVTILFTVTIDQDFSRSTDELLEKIYAFCVIWAVGTIFTETWFSKKPNKIISYALTGAISMVFVQMLSSHERLDRELEIITRFLGTYLILLILLSIYQTIQKAKLTFEEYLLKVFRDLFNTTAIYIILNIGIIILTSIFVQLILDGHYGSVMERLFVLLFGLFYVPAMVYTFSDISKKEVGSFIKGLVLYVLLPLTSIAIAIIYLYIAKIIVLQDMPQNTIYRILAGIFVVAFPVWNMAKNYAEEKKIMDKITTWLPYLYAPFLLLEIYSIGTRINEFGMTPMRYLSCAFIVFQMVALGLTFYQKNKKISQICLYAGGLVLIVLVSPLNYENVSNWSQKRILEKAMPEKIAFEALSDEAKKQVRSAYAYLQAQEGAEKYLPSYLTEEEKNKIEEYSKTNEREYDYPEYISARCNLDLDLQEYRRIIHVSNEYRENGTKVQLTEIDKTFDLNDKIQEIIQQDQTSKYGFMDEDFEGNNVVKISDTEEFFIEHLSFSYYKNSGKLNYVNVEGYWLEKR